MKYDNLKERTKRFSLDIIHLVESIPLTSVGKVIRNQLLRSGTSVGANYRSACRAKSMADFIAKMAIVEEEIDESLYWMELLVDTNMKTSNSLNHLMKEAHELLAISIASMKTAKSKKS